MLHFLPESVHVVLDKNAVVKDLLVVSLAEDGRTVMKKIMMSFLSKIYLTVDIL